MATEEQVMPRATAAGLSSLETSKVLKNTYRLLSMTLAFSAVVAAGSAALNLPHPGLLLTLGGYFGLLFLTSALKNSAWGLVSVFALTGFMGYTLGPILNLYLQLSNGAALIATALGTTAVAFLGLSAYARSENAIDMMRFTSFLMIGIVPSFRPVFESLEVGLPPLTVVIMGIAECMRAQW